MPKFLYSTLFWSILEPETHFDSVFADELLYNLTLYKHEGDPATEQLKGMLAACDFETSDRSPKKGFLYSIDVEQDGFKSKVEFGLKDADNREKELGDLFFNVRKGTEHLETVSQGRLSGLWKLVTAIEYPRRGQETINLYTLNSSYKSLELDLIPRFITALYIHNIKLAEGGEKTIHPTKSLASQKGAIPPIICIHTVDEKGKIQTKKVAYTATFKYIKELEQEAIEFFKRKINEIVENKLQKSSVFDKFPLSSSKEKVKNLKGLRPLVKEKTSYENFKEFYKMLQPKLQNLASFTEFTELSKMLVDCSKEDTELLAMMLGNQEPSNKETKEEEVEHITQSYGN